MKKQLRQIWEYAQSVNDADDLPNPPDFTTIDKEKVQDTVNKLNEVLGKKENIDKKLKAKLNYVTKNYSINIARYEPKEAILGDRTAGRRTASFSKRDPDATFMRLKGGSHAQRYLKTCLQRANIKLQSIHRQL